MFLPFLHFFQQQLHLTVTCRCVPAECCDYLVRFLPKLQADVQRIHHLDEGDQR
jgi:hypothetical protein